MFTNATVVCHVHPFVANVHLCMCPVREGFVMNAAVEGECPPTFSHEQGRCSSFLGIHLVRRKLGEHLYEPGHLCMGKRCKSHGHSNMSPANIRKCPRRLPISIVI